MTALIRGLSVVNRIIGKVFCTGAWTLLAVMTGVVVASVFFRYVLNSSLTWAEDVSLMMMIWMAFLVAPTAYRHGANVSLETVRALFKGRAAHLLGFAINALLVVLFVFVIIEAWEFIGRSRIRANTVDIQMKYIYMIMPAAFGALIVVGAELLCRNLLGIASPGAPEAMLDEPTPGSAGTTGVMPD